MTQRLVRLADVTVPELGPDYQGTLGRASCEQTLAVPALKQFTDLGTVMVPGRIKTLAIEVTTLISQAGSGQATVRLYAGVDNSGVAGAGGATSQIGSYTGPHQYRGAATNWSTSASTIPVGVYFFDAIDIPALAQWYPYVGVEVSFAVGDPTAGVLAAHFYPSYY